jgi:WD40 repeat protein
MRFPSPSARWLRTRRPRGDIGFGAFISYSGQRDRELITKLQNGIEKLAKKWYRPPVMKVFVDKTSIAAGARLWSRIESGLSRSKWLILMASPEAAQSWWVDQEVNWWVTHRSLDNLIIVHTSGALQWDRDTSDFSADSNAIPPCLRGKFDDEPVWATVPRDDRRPTNIESAVLSITSAVRQTPIHELSSQAYREHRRTLRWAGGAIATLSVLLVAALTLSVVAVVQKRHADHEARVALSRQLASTSASNLLANPRAALLLAVTAYRMDRNPQTLAALAQANTASPKLVRYFGAESTVTQLDGSGDGKTMVFGLEDGRVLRWSLADPKPTVVIKLSKIIRSLGVSRDGSAIIASDESTAALWRSGRGSVPLPVPDGQDAKVVSVSPSGTTAVVYSESTKLDHQSYVVFDAATATQRAAYQVANSNNQRIVPSFMVASSDDDILLLTAVGWQHRRITDWTLTRQGAIEISVHPEVGIPSADGRFIAEAIGAEATAASVIPVWSTEAPTDPSHTDLIADTPMTEPVEAMALSPEGRYLAVGGAGSIYVAPVAPENAVSPAASIALGWHGGASSGVPAREPTLQVSGAGPVRDVRFFGDDTHLISATGNQVALWDLSQIDRLAKSATTLIDQPPCYACLGTGITFSPDGKHTALIGDAEISIQPSPGLPGIPHFLPLAGIPLWRNDGRLILVTEAESRPDEISNLIRQQGLSDVLRNVQVPSSTAGTTEASGADQLLTAALTVDGRSVVVVNDYGDIFVKDVDTAALRETVARPADSQDKSYFEDAAIADSADLIAMVKVNNVGDFGGSVRLYDLRNHRTIGAIAGNDINSVRFAARRLLVQRQNGNLEVWDEKGTSISRVLHGDAAYYVAPVANRKGNLVARMRNQTTIDLFDLDTGTLLDTLPPFSGITKVGYTFSPDSDVLATAIDSDDHNARLVVRDFTPQGLLSAACTAAGSNLSSDEWRSLTGTTPSRVATC